MWNFMQQRATLTSSEMHLSIELLELLLVKDSIFSDEDGRLLLLADDGRVRRQISHRTSPKLYMSL